MSNLQTYYHFELDFQKVDQHTGGKWLIHGTKRHKDNQLQSLEPPVEYSSRECKHDIKESKRKHVQSNIQGECPGAETSRELCICRTKITYVKEA